MTDSSAQRRQLSLALIGIGVSAIGVALTLHPLKAPVSVFWVLVGAAVLVAAVSMCSASLKRLRRARRAPHPRLLASECRRVSEMIASLINEQGRRRPRSKPFMGLSEESRARWDEETVRRYNEELRIPVKRVYDDTVACGVVTDSWGLLVESPQASQLPSLRNLFREAADTLERM